MLPLKAKILQKQKEEAEKKEEAKQIGPSAHLAPKKRKVEESENKMKAPEKLPCPFPESKNDLEERSGWIKMDGGVTKPITPPKNKKRGLVDYDTESSSSTGSSGKNSRTPSKREKFLAKKASRLKALGNVEDDLSSKVQTATLNSPAPPLKKLKENLLNSTTEKKTPEKAPSPKVPEKKKESLLDKPWVEDKQMDPEELAALKELVGDYEAPIGPQPQEVNIGGILNGSTFLTKGVESWDKKKSNHDQQLEKDVKNQKKSVFNRLDLEYDQERIEKYERKREKVEKKKRRKETY